MQTNFIRSNFVRLGLAALLATLSSSSARAAEALRTPAMYFGDATRMGRPFAKDPSVIKHGGRYLMYYSAAPSTNKTVPKGWAIGIAESRDLVHWQKAGELLPAQDCDKNGLCAAGARVIVGRVHLFYQTYGNGPRDAICHAVSDDGLRFTRDPSNPVFHASGDWTSGRASMLKCFPSATNCCSISPRATRQ